MFDRDEMDHHHEMTRPCGRGGWSALPLNVCRREKKSQIKHPSECEPSSGKQPPVGLQAQSEGEQEAEEEPESSCTISFSYSYGWFRLFKDDPEVYARLEMEKKKAFSAQQSLWNITKWRETQAKLVSGH